MEFLVFALLYLPCIKRFTNLLDVFSRHTQFDIMMLGDTLVSTIYQAIIMLYYQVVIV